MTHGKHIDSRLQHRLVCGHVAGQDMYCAESWCRMSKQNIARARKVEAGRQAMTLKSSTDVGSPAIADFRDKHVFVPPHHKEDISPRELKAYGFSWMNEARAAFERGRSLGKTHVGRVLTDEELDAAKPKRPAEFAIVICDSVYARCGVRVDCIYERNSERFTFFVDEQGTKVTVAREYVEEYAEFVTQAIANTFGKKE